MRVLRNDFARYNVSDEDALEDFQQDDYGWKIIHSDVFRFPGYRALLSSILGKYLATKNGSSFHLRNS